jgi:hypothetical protein
MRTITLFLILALLSALILKEGFFGMSFLPSFAGQKTYALACNNGVVDGFGMSPGTLTQLESTHVGNPMGSYLIF